MSDWESKRYFMVLGEPKGKGRPRFARRGNYVHTYTPDKTREYEDQVLDSYLELYRGQPPLQGALSMGIVARFGMPKSLSKVKKRALACTAHVKAPDSDNLAKAVQDALNGVAYEDDKQISMLTVTKSYVAIDEEPHISVFIEELSDGLGAVEV